MKILYERCIFDAKKSETVSDTHKLYQTHITHFFRSWCLICSIICKPLFSFQTQNQACQQLTHEMDKEYKKLSDNIKEGSEKVKVQISMPVVSCEYSIVLILKYGSPFSGKVQADYCRGTILHSWYYIHVPNLLFNIFNLIAPLCFQN
jgi:hypothetical protein